MHALVFLYFLARLQLLRTLRFAPHCLAGELHVLLLIKLKKSIFEHVVLSRYQAHLFLATSLIGMLFWWLAVAAEIRIALI